MFSYLPGRRDAAGEEKRVYADPRAVPQLRFLHMQNSLVAWRHRVKGLPARQICVYTKGSVQSNHRPNISKWSTEI